MKVLVLNCGSSSVKFQLIETSLEAIENETDQILAKGQIEKIGMTTSVVHFEAEGKPPLKETPTILEHKVAISKVIKMLTDPEHGAIKDRRRFVRLAIVWCMAARNLPHQKFSPRRFMRKLMHVASLRRFTIRIT